MAGNGSTSSHDFELTRIGETSEYVYQALEKGECGMAYEFNYIGGNQINTFPILYKMLMELI